LYSATQTLSTLSETRKSEVCAIVAKGYNNIDLTSTQALSQLSKFAKEYDCDSLKKLDTEVKTVLKTFKSSEDLRSLYFAVDLAQSGAHSDF